jgi:uncharacterized protein YuzE
MLFLCNNCYLNVTVCCERTERDINAKNKKIDDLTIFDLDKEGNLLGIEILEASARIPKESLLKVHVKNIMVA